MIRWRNSTKESKIIQCVIIGFGILILMFAIHRMLKSDDVVNNETSNIVKDSIITLTNSLNPQTTTLTTKISKQK